MRMEWTFSKAPETTRQPIRARNAAGQGRIRGTSLPGRQRTGQTLSQSRPGAQAPRRPGHFQASAGGWNGASADHPGNSSELRLPDGIASNSFGRSRGLFLAVAHSHTRTRGSFRELLLLPLSIFPPNHTFPPHLPTASRLLDVAESPLIPPSSSYAHT
jgi:hypothetical protein